MNSQLKKFIGQDLEARGITVCVAKCWPVLKLPEPLTMGMFTEASSQRRDGILNTFPAPLLSPENEGWC